MTRRLFCSVRSLGTAGPSVDNTSEQPNRTTDSVPRLHRRVRRGVIGIISRGMRYLVIRRAGGIAKGGRWCFPGGHLEPGETSRQAIQRELAEELGIRVMPVKRVGSVRVIDSNYILAVWRVEHTAGEFHPAEQEIAEIRWLLPDEVRTIQPGLPSTARVMDMLEA